jgi:hypothetical protein
MNYLFKGKLQGWICAECVEPLSKVTVRLYRVFQQENLVTLATASEKQTFRILTDEEVGEKRDRLLAETDTDAQGNYTFELGENSDYHGEPFEIDVYCEKVPGQKSAGNEPPPLQFSITTLQPRWRESDNGLVAAWDYTLPYRFWCGIRARFGAWVICGRVVMCKTKTPVQGVRVHAFDVDWIQDDALGMGSTDASGLFFIYYSAQDFQQTPLSPWINWEMIGGPDIYFMVDTPLGSQLLIEPRSRGRDSDRENAGPCFCVELCLEKRPPDIQKPDPIPLFTHVGGYDVHSANPALGDFDLTDGTTKSGGFAFTGDIALRGILPDGYASDPVEYRFRIAKHQVPGPGLGPVQNVDGGMIPKTRIGTLEFLGWNGTALVPMYADYWVNNPGAQVTIPLTGGSTLTVSVNKAVDPDGWIQVPTEHDLTEGGVGLFVPNSWLITLDTEKLSNELFDLTSATPPLPVKAGDSVPAAQRSEAPTFRLFFEARSVATPHAAKGSNQLDRIAISNTRYKYERHPGWAGSTPTTDAVVSLDIAEMLAGTGCDNLTKELHALFTVYHPYLADARLYFEGNPPLPVPASFTAPIVGGEAHAGAPGQLFDISGLNPCAYILWLRAELNLTRGWDQIPNPYLWDRIAFCVGKEES